VALAEQTVYTIFAMGLARGEQAVASVDAPALLPATGQEGGSVNYGLIVLGAGMVLAPVGLVLQRRLQMKAQ
jgi:hypothetical protein